MSSLWHGKEGGPFSGMGGRTENSAWPFFLHLAHSVLHVVQMVLLQTHAYTGFLIMGHRRAS